MAKRGIHRQAQLHRMTGIPKNTISDLFNNEAASVEFQDLDAICKALNCEITDILERAPEPPKDSENISENIKDSKMSTSNTISKRKHRSIT